MDIGDIDGLGGGSKKGRPFPQFETERLAEAVSGISAAEKAIKDAMAGSAVQHALDQLALGDRTLRGSEQLAEQMRALTAPFGAGIAERLAELDTANEALRGLVNHRFGMGVDQELIDRIKEGPDLAGYLSRPAFPEPLAHDFPEIPPNPIFETNALLEKLSTDFEEMKAVTAATADVQEKQAALIGDLLKASVEGSAAQERAAHETLRVAKISMWISLVAVMLTLAGVGAQALLG